MRKRHPRVDDLVFINNRMTARYGKVTGIGPIYRVKTHKDEKFYSIRYISPETGKLVKCPDSRCTDGCVICSTGCWIEDVEIMSKDAIELFLESKMLVPALVPSKVSV